MNILVIGDGSAGQRHARILESREQTIKVVGPFDTLNTKGWDAVVIASPPEWHSEHLGYIQFDQPILCEGPMTEKPYPDSSVRMMASNWRFIPRLMLLRHRIQSRHPVMAHLWFNYDLMRWRPDVDMRKTCYYYSGHDMINVHEVDLALWMFGPAERVHIERIHTGKSKGCDGFQMLIKHARGCLTTISSCWYSAEYQRGLNISYADGSSTQLSWRSPEDDHIINKSYETVVDTWLCAIENKNMLVEPSFMDGYRAWKLLQGECV